MTREVDDPPSVSGNMFADARIAEALVDAVGGWADWCHRRVDSVHPEIGERGRVRHSMDCSPPPDPWLAYLPEERGASDVAKLEGQMVVPLAMVEKEPMRELNATDNEGRPIPLLGMDENVQLAVAMMKYLAGRNGVEVPAALERLFAMIAGPFRDGQTTPTALATVLTSTGQWGGQQYWAPERLAPEVTDLIHDFASGFLLAGLLPARALGLRQVVKISFHWRIEFVDSWPMSLWDRARVSFRAAERSVALPMMAPSDARSYHLEFQTPPELDCVRLELPRDDEVSRPGMVDVSGQPVAHVHTAYSMPPNGVARAYLSVPRRGLWTYAVLATLVTSVTLWLIQLLPGADEVFDRAGESAAAVLLALPAVLIGAAAGRRESALSAWMLTFLRGVMLTCSITLLVLGWALVGRLREPWDGWLWALSTGITSALLLGIAMIGPLISLRRRRASRVRKHLGEEP